MKFYRGGRRKGNEKGANDNLDPFCRRGPETGKMASGAEEGVGRPISLHNRGKSEKGRSIYFLSRDENEWKKEQRSEVRCWGIFQRR